MVCDRVAIIVKGRIRYEGAIDEILESGDGEADLVVAGLSAEMAAALESDLGARMRGLGDRIEVRVPAKSASDALRLALESGAEVVSLTPHRVSLESVFLSAVDESDADGESR